MTPLSAQNGGLPKTRLWQPSPGWTAPGGEGAQIATQKAKALLAVLPSECEEHEKTEFREEAIHM